MEKVKHIIVGVTKYFNLNKSELDGGFNNIEKINEPILVYSQYGWRDGSKPRNVTILYPPFKLIEFVPGDVYAVGSVILECSAKHRIEKFIAKYKYIPNIPIINKTLIENIIKEYSSDGLDSGIGILISPRDRDHFYERSTLSLEEGLSPKEYDIEYSFNDADIIKYCKIINDREILMKQINIHNKIIFINDTKISIYKDLNIFEIKIPNITRCIERSYINIDEKYLKQILELIKTVEPISEETITSLK